MLDKKIVYDDVVAAAEQIKMAGECPSLSNVSELLGAVGFNQDIVTWIEQWYQGQTEFIRHDFQPNFGVKLLEQNPELMDKRNQDLEEMLSLVRATLESTEDGILLINAQGQVTDWNEKFTKMWRLPVELLEAGPESLGFEYVLDQVSNPEELIKEVERLYANPDAVGDLGLLHFKDGRIFERYSQPHKVGDTIVGRVWSFRDVTTRYMAKKELEIHSRVIEVSHNGVFIIDCNTDENPIIYINPALTIITGYAADDVLGQSIEVLQNHIDKRNGYGALIKAMAEQRDEKISIAEQTKEGEPYWAEVQLSRVNGDDIEGEYYIGIMHDTTLNRKMEYQLEQHANFCPVTNLPNRSLMNERSQQMISLAQKNDKCALIYIDLDEFKLINESIGHALGDFILKIIASRMEFCIRDSDTLARIGGDEFVIVMPNFNGKDEVIYVVDRVIHEIRKQVRFDGFKFDITASIGVSFFPDDALDSDELLKCADLAMYSAKESGRNGYKFYEKEMNDKVQSRIRIESALKSALKCNEFHLLYQPLIDLKTQTITGVECLLRWNSAELGFVSPVQFIPVAENSDIIMDIGCWVLNEACRQNMRWINSGLTGLTIAVNISARQFRSDMLVDQVKQVLDETHMPAELLELELTESFLIHDHQAVIDLLNELKSLGIKIAIDDFGTGYSSLAYLQKFAVDKLKIDRSFVNDLQQENCQDAITKAIIGLAHSLDLCVLAEGVETEFQKKYLIDNHCDAAQGYLYSKPIAADEIVRFINDSIQK